MANRIQFMFSKQLPYMYALTTVPLQLRTNQFEVSDQHAATP